MLYAFIYNIKSNVVLDYFDSYDSCLTVMYNYIYSPDSYFSDPSYVYDLDVRGIFVPLTCDDIYRYICDRAKEFSFRINFLI